MDLSGGVDQLRVGKIWKNIDQVKVNNRAGNKVRTMAVIIFNRRQLQHVLVILPVITCISISRIMS